MQLFVDLVMMKAHAVWSWDHQAPISKTLVIGNG